MIWKLGTWGFGTTTCTPPLPDAPPAGDTPWAPRLASIVSRDPSDDDEPELGALLALVLLLPFALIAALFPPDVVAEPEAVRPRPRLSACPCVATAPAADDAEFAGTRGCDDADDDVEEAEAPE
jgi:hypothetical protein